MAAAGDAGRAGDSVANATHDLYRQYGKQIYAYCLHQLRSREEAEDAVQTTFLNAFRGLQRGTTTRFEQAWLYKIAQNVCIARRSSSGQAPPAREPRRLRDPRGGRAVGRRGRQRHPRAHGARRPRSSGCPRTSAARSCCASGKASPTARSRRELDLSQGAVEMLIFRARRTLAMALEEPAAAKRRSGKAKTGFSFGSLIAAMKGLFATGAAVKMAAVAVSAGAVGTNAAVHSVVHRAVTHEHVRAAVAPQIVQATTQARRPERARRRSSRGGLARIDVAATRHPPVRTGVRRAAGVSGPKPVIVQDVSAELDARPAGDGGSPCRVRDRARVAVRLTPMRLPPRRRLRPRRQQPPVASAATPTQRRRLPAAPTARAARKAREQLGEPGSVHHAERRPSVSHGKGNGDTGDSTRRTISWLQPPTAPTTEPPPARATDPTTTTTPTTTTIRRRLTRRRRPTPRPHHDHDERPSTEHDRRPPTTTTQTSDADDSGSTASPPSSDSSRRQRSRPRP